MNTIHKTLRRFFTRCGILWSLLATSACMHGIRIIGIDQNGEKNVKVPKEHYEKEVGNALAETHDAALAAMDDLPEEDPNDIWELDYIMVGVGIEGQVGIANIIALRAFPRFRLYFTRE